MNSPLRSDHFFYAFIPSRIYIITPVLKQIALFFLGTFGIELQGWRGFVRGFCMP